MFNKFSLVLVLKLWYHSNMKHLKRLYNGLFIFVLGIGAVISILFGIIIIHTILVSVSPTISICIVVGILLISYFLGGETEEERREKSRLNDTFS